MPRALVNIGLSGLLAHPTSEQQTSDPSANVTINLFMDISPMRRRLDADDDL